MPRMYALVSGALLLQGATANRLADDGAWGLPSIWGSKKKAPVPDMDQDEMPPPGAGAMPPPPGGMPPPMMPPMPPPNPLSPLEAKVAKLEHIMMLMDNKVFPECKDKPTRETCAMSDKKCMWKAGPKKLKDEEPKGKEAKGKDGKGGKEGKSKKSSLLSNEDKDDKKSSKEGKDDKTKSSKKGKDGKKASLLEEEAAPERDSEAGIPKRLQAMMTGAQNGLNRMGQGMASMMPPMFSSSHGKWGPKGEEVGGPGVGECVEVKPKEEAKGKGKGKGKDGKGKEAKNLPDLDDDDDDDDDDHEPDEHKHKKHE